MGDSSETRPGRAGGRAPSKCLMFWSHKLQRVFLPRSFLRSLEDPQEVFKNVVGQHEALLSSC